MRLFKDPFVSLTLIGNRPCISYCLQKSSFLSNVQHIHHTWSMHFWPIEIQPGQNRWSCANMAHFSPFRMRWNSCNKYRNGGNELDILFVSLPSLSKQHCDLSLLADGCRANTPLFHILTPNTHSPLCVKEETLTIFQLLLLSCFAHFSAHLSLQRAPNVPYLSW